MEAEVLRRVCYTAKRGISGVRLARGGKKNRSENVLLWRWIVLIDVQAQKARHKDVPKIPTRLLPRIKRPEAMINIILESFPN